MGLLINKNIVVTGSLRGIGRSTLEIFAKNKANIFACIQYPDEEFEAFVQQLVNEYGNTITTICFDLSDTDSIKAGMRQISSTKEPIDGLVNIAGMVHNGLFHMTSIDTMREVFEINFFSQILITQYISKIMIKNKNGSIVNISSIAGIDGNHGQLAYSSSKAALIGATKTLSIELGQYGIRVNAIAPGVIITDMTKNLPQEKFNDLVQKSKIPRAGLPEEVANVLLYLVSDASKYVTGQIIRVDGGIG
jgi:3-oxoacyl-[acyl-carrier protein] reductase